MVESPGRRLMGYVPAAAAILGIIVVLSSGVFFFADHDVRRLAAVAVGLSVLVGGVWFAANPFLRSSRSFHRLRLEVDMFVAMVRELHRQTGNGAPPEAVERTRALMHKAVDRMVATAQEAKESPTGD